MSDSTSEDPHCDDSSVEAAPDSPPPTPLWVKVFGAVAIVVVLLFVVLLLAGRGHGPGRHSLPAGPNGHTPTAVAAHESPTP